MGCVESTVPAIRQGAHLIEENGNLEIEDPEKIAEWAKVLLMSRSLMIDFHDEDNVAFYEESDFVTETMRFTNLFRNRHSAPELKLSQELCQSAQTWANNLAHTGGFFHRNLPSTGECLFSKWNYTKDKDVTPEEVVEYWYRGNFTYCYDLDPGVLQINSSAFTQMVWVSTEEIGVGKARSRDGKYIVVAHYYPQGNVPGLFHENVLQPSSTGNGKRGVRNGRIAPADNHGDSSAPADKWASREILDADWREATGSGVQRSVNEVHSISSSASSVDDIPGCREVALRDIALRVMTRGENENDNERPSTPLSQ